MGTVIAFVTDPQQRQHEAQRRALRTKIELLRDTEEELCNAEYQYLKLRIRKVLLKAQIDCISTVMPKALVDIVHERVMVDQSVLDTQIVREFRALYDEVMDEIK